MGDQPNQINWTKVYLTLFIVVLGLSLLILKQKPQLDITIDNVKKECSNSEDIINTLMNDTGRYEIIYNDHGFCGLVKKDE